MRKIRDVLRLYFTAALSVRAIARSLGTSPSTVGEYLRRAKVAGLSWPVPESVDDAGLERRLFPAPPPSRAERPLPDWSEVHRELRRKSVTLALLWQEYKESHPEGLQYSWFCEQYRAWAGKLDLVMRQDHRAGEKLFVDYAGQTGRVDDWRGGGRRMGVAVPGGFRPLPVPHSPPWLRFQSPLIEPDVRISRIRLSDEIMPSPTESSSYARQGG